MTGDINSNNQKGFSLIEMITSTAILIFVILMVLSVFQDSIKSQKNSVATQAVQEGTRYALEVMSKELRSAIANIDESDQCAYDGLLDDPTSPSYKYYKVYNFHQADGVLYFRNKDWECVEYEVENGILYITRGADRVRLPITPAGLRVSNFRVDIEDDYANEFHETQPNITLVMDVESINDEYNDIRLQTTISSRHYE